MESSLETLKKTLCVYLVVSVMFGIGAIVGGACAVQHYTAFKHFVDVKVYAMAIVLIVAGCSAFVIALVGWRGCVEDDYDKIMAFLLSLLVLFGGELAIGIIGAVIYNELPTIVRQALADSMISFSVKEEDAWNLIQETFKCCGITSKINWIEANTGRSSQIQSELPNSCCAEISKDKACNAFILKGMDSPYEVGCWDTIDSKIKSIASIMMGVGFPAALIQLLGMILSGRLAMILKREGDTVE